MNERGFSLIEMLIVTVITVVAIGVVTSMFVQGNQLYASQRAFDEARSNASAALDMTVRVLRGAQTIQPDPDGNLVADSIRAVSDWNPRDGDTADAYEDVTFSVAGGTLFKREPADAAPVAFADRVESMAFVYRNPAGALVATPWTAVASQLAYVQVTVRSTPINGTRVTVKSSASVRRRD